jgi:hypothetical protein
MTSAGWGLDLERGVKMVENAVEVEVGGTEEVTDMGRWMEKKEATWMSAWKSVWLLYLYAGFD